MYLTKENSSDNINSIIINDFFKSMQMKIEKQHVRVKIRTDSSIVVGTVHTLVDGRLSDYITSQRNRFIPVTDAEVRYIEGSKKDLDDNKVRRQVVFINVEKVEMIEYL